MNAPSNDAPRYPAMEMTGPIPPAVWVTPSALENTLIDPTCPPVPMAAIA